MSGIRRPGGPASSSLAGDVTPTGGARHTRIRAAALLAPLAAAALVMLVAALRGLALPWASAGLTLVGNVLPGFAAACAVRTRTGEPGAAASTAVVLVLLAPSLVPQGHAQHSAVDRADQQSVPPGGPAVQDRGRAAQQVEQEPQRPRPDPAAGLGQRARRKSRPASQPNPAVSLRQTPG